MVPIVFWAGSPTDSTRSLVLQATCPRTDPRGCSFTEHFTGTESGALRIVGEQNDQLTLHAANGEVFIFDMPSRQFVTTTPAPTFTPSPTETPLVLTPSP
ncbi:MAG: hypothetical protein MUD01_28375 [Chloroflexaceae bacterium]|nr:hypothetical protein [Chloroflexaceae bacterium]